jgi:hypothetical protein
MTNEKVMKSKLGISFTGESVDLMRKWAKEIAKDNLHAVWTVCLDRHNDQMGVVLGADYHPHHTDIPDQVAGFTFYWRATYQPGIEVLRNCTVDSPSGKARLINAPRIADWPIP